LTGSGSLTTKRLRFLLRHGSRVNVGALDGDALMTFVPMEAIGEKGSLDTSTFRPLASVQSGYTRFSDGDVIVAKITPCFENGKGALARGLSGGVGYGTTELHVLSAGADLEPRFLYYVTASAAFRLQGEGHMSGSAGQKRVPEDFVRDYRIPVWPMPRQCAIADYLDRETARLDALVSAKERMLTLMTEKRNALATHLVFHGANEGIPRRDSGVPWIGSIPEHWETERTRWLFQERDERSDTGREEMMTVSHITGVTRRSEKDVNMFEAETTNGYKLCYPGDFVTNTLWAWMGAMGVAREHGIVSPAYNVYTVGPRLNPEYIDTISRLPIFAQEVTRYSKGVWSSRLRLYPEGFFEVHMPVPPLDEQRRIVARFATESARMDSLRRATERSLLLLQERRSALISAAVTGAL
jgi:type I restriction enzyme S subunit